MTVVAEDRDRYRAGFERFASAHAGEPSWLRDRRTAAIARFVERGLPTPRDEAWRHTPTAPLARAGFEPADPAARPAGPLGDVLLRGQGFRGIELVLVNGRFAPELSSAGAGQPGLDVRSLRDALKEAPQGLEPWLGRVADGGSGAFADLNTAFAEDGAVVRVAPGTIVTEPVHVVHLVAGGEGAAVAYARTLVVAGKGSECAVVQSFASPDGVASLTNASTEVVVEDDARVELARLQREGQDSLHVASVAARLGRDARFRDHGVALGAALSRNDLLVRFEAPGGEAVLNGLFALDGRRVADTHSTVDHAQPHCTSRELYKGVLDGASRGVFSGLVRVRAGAQKTDAQQMNKNLLLSREALVHSTPQLEILADDVKCKHGSTTGQLDANALFYLRSRGLGEAAARSLLTWAFAADLVRQLPAEPVRRAVERHLAAHLTGVGGIAEQPA